MSNTEDPRNIRHCCPKHSPKPDPKYLEKPPEWFLGRFCKLGFPLTGDGPTHEHMWVKVEDYSDECLKGTLENDPLYAELSYGDEIEFTRDEIEDVYTDTSN